MFEFFQCGDRLYTSESDVYSRQILTYDDGLRTDRVNYYYCKDVVAILAQAIGISDYVNLLFFIICMNISFYYMNNNYD